MWCSLASRMKSKPFCRPRSKRAHQIGGLCRHRPPRQSMRNVRGCGNRARAQEAGNAQRNSAWSSTNRSIPGRSAIDTATTTAIARTIVKHEPCGWAVQNRRSFGTMARRHTARDPPPPRPAETDGTAFCDSTPPPSRTDSSPFPPKRSRATLTRRLHGALAVLAIQEDLHNRTPAWTSGKVSGSLHPRSATPHAATRRAPGSGKDRGQLH